MARIAASYLLSIRVISSEDQSSFVQHDKGHPLCCRWPRAQVRWGCRQR